ncbi:methionine--tRNA ligase [Selenomonas bovis]|uniref:methionine--tRNA ligase n=1 Tax=Selenomonas bovis TaxID=416586 RepID=UPI0004E28431|nr:methionine--tRNA ligase [Selenomonas bovis]MDY6300146.1 methionine--tRNA ligase [Selenomonadaceae bacterium]
MHEKKPFYITTPIYYPSAKLHIGHAYCTTIADAIARFHRLEGDDVFFLTGSDEHGLKIQQKAEEAGVTPIEYTDKIVAGFQNLWKRLSISNDDFIRTTQKRHERVVQEVFRRIYAKGDIYKGEYKGLYCTPCESYWTEHQLDENGCCPDCHRPVQEVAEEAYFFKMSKYQDRVLQYIEDHPDFIQPVSRRNEMINFIKQGLDDLCISRTSFNWGIPVPIDPKHVIYVWFDALTNYLTPIGYLDDPEKFQKYWPADLHLVGKEIVRFHTIIWPCILMALDLPLPKKVYGHGWLIVDGDKMSKSKGNVVDPIGLIDEFGADAIRYFLLREINLGQDGNFSRDALIGRINSDLANDLGNLLHRTLSMTLKFQDGVVAAPAGESDVDRSLKEDARETVAFFEQNMEDMQLSLTIKKVWAFISRANKYIDETAPWALAKDPAKKQELANVLYNLTEALRVISVLISPFMPTTAVRIWQQLGLAQDFASVRTEDIEQWGGVPAGLHVGTPEQLFPRIEVEKEEAAPQPAAAKQEKKEKKDKKDKQAQEALPEGIISIDTFGKVQLRVAEVKAAEPVPKADKLLKLTLSLGEGVPERQVVSGIAPWYAPSDLVGKHVVLVANLKPAKLRGVRSEGMILAAGDGKDLKILEVDMPAGTEVR